MNENLRNDVVEGAGKVIALFLAGIVLTILALVASWGSGVTSVLDGIVSGLTHSRQNDGSLSGVLNLVSGVCAMGATVFLFLAGKAYAAGGKKK
jgi:hypothetical protein